ncbi:hypothetical protein [Prescottella equi]
MKPIACDRDGRHWVLVTTDGTLRGRLVRGEPDLAAIDLADLIEAYGPLVLSPARPTVGGGYAAFADTVDLVASDPGTASVEQIAQVAAFAKSMVALTGPRPA